ncbi:hypothetical protein NPIL_107371 [Nephila pilipes]|uniref:Uncharacterized protein n=1 Tax=Nephila pilipes TaxID=299642 RepID=A0A8X6TS90_NEPPI|nr:hypothetical protein NPIL_107371 [Nephila pilipes]
MVSCVSTWSHYNGLAVIKQVGVLLYYKLSNGFCDCGNLPFDEWGIESWGSSWSFEDIDEYGQEVFEVGYRLEAL